MCQKTFEQKALRNWNSGPILLVKNPMKDRESEPRRLRTGKGTMWKRPLGPNIRIRNDETSNFWQLILKLFDLFKTFLFEMRLLYQGRLNLRIIEGCIELTKAF